MDVERICIVSADSPRVSRGAGPWVVDGYKVTQVPESCCVKYMNVKWMGERKRVCGVDNKNCPVVSVYTDMKCPTI